MASPTNLSEKRAALAAKHGFIPCPAPTEKKVGISRSVRSGLWPINGVRVEPTEETTGWYIWAGEEMSDEPDFFVPLHAAHLEDWCPNVLPYLELPPGWRFLVAPGQEEVWFDETVDTSTG